MTARICPVHGEWSATGSCRWCEEPKRMPTNLPAGSTPCRCGEYSWLPECSLDMREGVISGVFHSPAQCFKLDAVVRDAASLQRAMDEAWCNLVTRGFVGIELRFDESEYTEAYIDAETHAAEQSRLDAQHAALRWERVARRWNYKHREVAGLGEYMRAYVWRCWLAQMERRYLHITWTPGQPP